MCGTRVENMCARAAPARRCLRRERGAQRTLANLDTQLSGHMLQQRGEEVDVFDENLRSWRIAHGSVQFHARNS